MKNNRKVYSNEKDKQSHLRKTRHSVLASLLWRDTPRPASNKRGYRIHAQQLLALLRLAYGAVVFLGRYLADCEACLSCEHGNGFLADSRLYRHGRSLCYPCAECPDSRLFYSLWRLWPRAISDYLAYSGNGERTA